MKAHLQASRPQYFLNHHNSLSNEKYFFTEWSHSEDTALFSDEKSHEHAVLLKTKGASELEKRRCFLLGGYDGIEAAADIAEEENEDLSGAEDL